MKQIVRGQSNSLYCTVTEKSTLSSPYWLIRLVGDSSQKSYSFVKSNTSAYTERYDLFSITEGVDATLPKGIYTYYIYEQTSPSNTDYTQATTLCEVGQVLVVETTDPIRVSHPSYTIESSYSSQ